MLGDDLIQALDPVEFARRSLSFEPDGWQARVLRWDGRRALLNCSRQAGKSTTAAVKALHRAKYHPGSLTLLVSPTLRQSGELFRKVTEMRARLTVPLALVEDNKLSMTTSDGSRIVSLPGSEDTIRGFSGADLIIEDEASRVPDELFMAIRPMLAVSNGQLMLMSTPFGKIGHFFEAWQNGGEMWERVRVTAYDCPRITPEFINGERASMPAWWFEQEYLCEFKEALDQVFGYDLIMSAISRDVQSVSFEDIYASIN
jgi:hypothetical protein